MQLQTRRMDLSRQKNTIGTLRLPSALMHVNDYYSRYSCNRQQHRSPLGQGILATCSRNELVSRCDATTGRREWRRVKSLQLQYKDLSWQY